MTKNHSRDIAIIGMACRLPGGMDDLDTLLASLRARKVTAGPVPADRWDTRRYFAADEHAKGKAYVERGNFLTQDIRAMDAGFFDLPARLAETLDPMQRLLLELTWEAFENAGLDLTAHAGKQVGVYVGGFMLDHMITLMQPENRARHNAGTAAGMMMTMLSNRLSHAFDLRGPSLSIDTACSSSLVAFSYACRDIWNGDCEMAVVGGANVMTRPEYPIGMCKGQFLSRDGECKSFDARGDGYGRGEGGGVIVLKTLERALADGDEILATVAGAGVNSDGRTPGISMPSAEAQSALIRDVCERFNIDRSNVRYVECHGTGTAVGDPIEAESIGSVYGAGRAGDARVVIGSIKSNIGHLEAGAGVAGLIKAVLTLMKREAFALGNLQTPHPGIDFERLGVRLADGFIPLAKENEPFLVAVNSFGYGGTNAHVVLKSAPVAAKNERQALLSNSLSLPLSARHPDALRTLAARYRERLESADTKLGDVLYTAAMRRAHLSHRAVAMGADRAELIEALDALARGEKSDAVVTGQKAAHGKSLPVWVFTGMGPQWWGMGQQLYQEDAVYRDAVDNADRVFQGIAGFSILAEMLKDQESSRITQTVYAQPANFIVQWGVAAMLLAAGVQPGALVGHSVGEVTSAAVSGALTLDDAMRVVYERSRLQATTAGTGSMLAAGTSAQSIQTLLDAHGGCVEIAAINGPNTITLAGETAAIEAIAAELARREIFNRVLNVEVPYHSHLMEPILGELKAALNPIKANLPAIPTVSTVTGRYFDGPAFDAHYWRQNVRRSVAFMDAIQTLLDDGFVTFVEVGPHPVLASALRDCAKVRANEIRLVETLRRNEQTPEPECARMRRAVAQIYASGATIDWTCLNGRGKFIGMPNYPWQRERLWPETERATYRRLGTVDRPMLGCEHYPAHHVWVNDLEHQGVAWLKDHVVSGTAIMPAAGYIETLFEAAATVHPDACGWSIGNLRIHAPLVLSNDRAIDYFSAYDSESRRVSIRSIESGRNGAGTLHLDGVIGALSSVDRQRVDIAAMLASCDSAIDAEAFYRDLSRLGLQYGPAFRAIRSLRVSSKGKNKRMAARIECPADLPQDGWRAHPSTLDACFQMLVGMLDDRESTWLPTGFDEMRLSVPVLPASFWCEARCVSMSANDLIADLNLIGDDGAVLAVIRGMRVTASSAKLARVDQWGDAVKLQLLRYEWSESAPMHELKRGGRWLVIEAEHNEAMSERIVAGLRDAGVSVVTAGASILDIEASFDGVVFVHGWNAGIDQHDPTATEALLDLHAVTRHFLALPAAARPRAYVVTREAFALSDDENVNPAQTALNGFTRVACSELDGMRFTSIDMPAEPSDIDARVLIAELIRDAEEDEISIRNGRRFVSQLGNDLSLSEPLIEPLSCAFSVRPFAGSEDASVRLIQAPRVSLGCDEIEVRAEALALENRALRASDDRGYDGEFVEIVGTVTAVGANVTDLAEGQRVYGFAPGEFASHLRGARDAFLVCPLADDVAAETVLVTAGQAAMAERAVEQIVFDADSHALVFADQRGLAVAAALRARDIDVTLIDARTSPDTLEALRGETRGFDLIAAPLADWSARFGWRCLAEGGTLIDTDRHARPTTIPHHCAMVVRTDQRHSARFIEALQRVVTRRDLNPAVSLSVTIEDLVTRKLTLTNDELPLIVHFNASERKLPVEVYDDIAFDPHATYLVTGGMGGFGQRTARWIADHGAKHLVLASRSGADTDERRAFVAALKADGVEVECVSCDVSDAVQIRDLFGLIASLNRPLRGVFHAAAVIADEAIVDLKPANLMATMRSKAESARLLHEHTKHLSLDHFVLFSSIANLVGNAKQGSYSSANGYLDGLAWHRRSLGLPATSINWGAIADVGVITRDETLAQFMRYIGLRGMESAEALNWLGRAMYRGTRQLGISLITNWGDWARYETLGAKSPRFADLIAADVAGEASAADSLRAELVALPQADRFTVLSGLLASVLADQLETSADSIAIDRPILDLGVDSLLATEIQLSLDKNLGISVSVLEILNDLTIRGMAERTLSLFGLDGEESKA
ncbi:type I polyketide synthase [Caballeronia sp. BR00000012568055]|uniref:type I polyketide synthase n=1 Tax=Caballeronia sp. BR00000012568055 TaxID=2918761 RepID=UPI0023F64B62|nr:type I polyketide synthase [Caballeronia sp. BR00000012568055]